jgi:hypothetical protein
MKWGDKYGPAYVNRLYGMVARNLSRPFRFVCFTDNGEGVRPEVEIQPLPSLDLPSGLPERGWMKLATFQPELGDLKGQTLFLDLDVVIVDSIRTGKPINEGVRLAEATMTGIMGRMSAYTGRALKWDWAMKASELDLSPAKYEMGPLPVAPVAMPGRTPLV